MRSWARVSTIISSTFTDDHVLELLLKLGFTEKEADVYLALLEYGTQPASVIARKTGQPKSTILFLFNGLVEKGYVRKAQRGRTQYFHVEVSDLEKAKNKEIQTATQTLSKAIPLLKEFKAPYSSEPKVTFFEGINGCKKAYSLLLNSQTEILEFGVHGDLEAKLGTKFIDDFIKKRVEANISLKAISRKDKIHKELSKLNKHQLR